MVDDNQISLNRDTPLADLISHPAQQWCSFAIVASIFCRIWHFLVLTFLDCTDPPCSSLFGLFEEVLILIKAAVACFWKVKVSPYTGKRIGDSENQENPVLEIIEHDWSDKSHAEIGNTPYDHTYCGAVGACCGRVYFCWNELESVSYIAVSPSRRLHSPKQ